MLAAYAARIDRADPLNALEVGEQPDPNPPDGWVVIDVKAASLNHHDLWALRGVGLHEDQCPMVLGGDAAGIDPDGNEVIVYPVITDPDWRRDETMDPQRTLLSEKFQGALAEKVAVPRRCLVAKPPELTWEEAACLPTAWLTAYRMLFTRGELTPGATVLVQGAGGGVATALIALASAAGLRVWVTTRSEAKEARALELGAERAFPTGTRLPERVDAVMETVGAATWEHSLRSCKPGGKIVVSGATSGHAPAAGLTRIFFLQLSVIGSTVGTRDELERVARFCVARDTRPMIHASMPLSEAREGFRALEQGKVFGKIVFTT